MTSEEEQDALLSDGELRAKLMKRRLQHTLEKRSKAAVVWNRVDEIVADYYDGSVELPKLQGDPKTHIEQLKKFIELYRETLRRVKLSRDITKDLRELVGPHVMAGFRKTNADRNRKRNERRKAKKAAAKTVAEEEEEEAHIELTMPEPEPNKSLLENSLFDQFPDIPPGPMDILQRQS